MKILILEDDELFRAVMNKALTDDGHEPVIADNGDDAIRRMGKSDFDLVITDLFMPEKEGFEVIQEIREMLPDIKIMAISSGGQAGYTSLLKVAEAFGANASLQKPFSKAQLLAKVNEMAGRQCGQSITAM